MIHPATIQKTSAAALLVVLSLVGGEIPSRICFPEPAAEVSFEYSGLVSSTSIPSTLRDPLACSTVRPAPEEPGSIRESLREEGPIAILAVPGGSQIAESPAEETGTISGRLGGLRPTGHQNPDGSEVWTPAPDSILAGRIELDVRPDGQVVRQRILRPQPGADPVD
ncbi:MAG: hypothetical protein COV76_07925 [Candidatus Omnitrophica bacterium CG11_big_fil_rev_8_21_14_0_20_64_10]|nr:MAG: hypothetical protein COV76_07925 [Candidatus Omnitrophica bacterium CG11_big_fil_rev_8_21_14_0_20_64_10]